MALIFLEKLCKNEKSMIEYGKGKVFSQMLLTDLSSV